MLAIALAKALHYLLFCLVSWAVKRVRQGLNMLIAQRVAKFLGFLIFNPDNEPVHLSLALFIAQCVTKCVGLHF